MKPRNLVATLLAISLLGSFVPKAQAQTQPWDTNVLTWVAPTNCSTGEPISACPVTGYRVEQAATTGGSYTAVATTAANAVTYTHAAVSAGQHCYRVIALSGNGVSVPSNVSCKTNVRPAGPPNPPVITVAQTFTGVDHSIVYTVLATGLRSNTVGGVAAVGVECTGPVLFTYRGRTYRKPAAWKRDFGVSSTANVAAPCA